MKNTNFQRRVRRKNSKQPRLWKKTFGRIFDAKEGDAFKVKHAMTKKQKVEHENCRSGSDFLIFRFLITIWIFFEFQKHSLKFDMKIT